MAQEKAADNSVETVDELKPGTQLLRGQFTIIKFLNNGGFGITYLARNSLDREVVIKECFPGAFCQRNRNSVGARSRAHQREFAMIVKLFVQEAKSLAKLIHPNIVGVHQVFEDNDTAYMAIDYVDGRDLQDIIDNDRKSMTPALIMKMVHKLLGAISFVHQHGILHRDISPDNILLSKKGEPVLIDFGAARQLATELAGKVLSAMRVVKEGYSPQEFYVSGSVQNDSSDLYSLAATFYHLISGTLPPSSQARLMAIAEAAADPCLPLAGRTLGYPEDFLAAIDKAMKVLPKERLQSAADWLKLIDSRPDLKVVPLAPRASDALAELPQPAVAAPAASAAATLTRMVADAGGIAEEEAEPSTAATNSWGVSTPPPARAKSDSESRSVAIGGAVALILVAVGITVFWPNAPEPEVVAALVVPGLEIVEAPEEPAAVDAPAVAAPAVDATAPAAPLLVALAATDLASVPAPDTAPLPTATIDAVVAPAVDASPAASPPADPAPAAVAASPAPEAMQPEPDEAVLSLQIDRETWSAQMPFTLAEAGTGSNPFPVVDALVSGFDPAPENAWIAPGVTIVAVNGNWVKTAEALTASVLGTAEGSNAEWTYAALRIKESGSVSFKEVTLAYKVGLTMSLKSGDVFAVSFRDGAFVTEVTSIAEPFEGGLLPGDVLLSDMATGEAIATVHGFDASLNKAAQAKLPSTSYLVLRSGAEVQAQLNLARKD